jgi:hypothetical protein
MPVNWSNGEFGPDHITKRQFASAETAIVVEIPARDDLLARRKAALVYTSVSRQTMSRK